jgi:Tc3 transposase
MPAERIGMRDARQIICLKFSSVSTHEIARRLNMARFAVRETLKRAEGAGLSWPFPESMNGETLRRRSTPADTANAAIGRSRNRTGPACVAN